MNYQQFPNGSYGYVQIASWEQGRLTIDGKIQWKGENSTPPDSVCSKECPKGYATVSFNFIDDLSNQKARTNVYGNLTTVFLLQVFSFYQLL